MSAAVFVLIGMVIVLGGFIIYRMKSNGGNILPEVPPIPGITPVSGMPQPGTSVPAPEETTVEAKLLSVGFSDDDIDDFYKWLDKDERSQPEILEWLEDRAKDLGLDV